MANLPTSIKNLNTLLGEQLTEGGVGGGYECTETRTTLTEESVTTVTEDDFAYGPITYSQLINADTIRVTFNGTEYECEKRVTSAALGDLCEYGAVDTMSPMGIDWSQYPFRITSGPGLGGVIRNELDTESAGTYTIKIEVPA